MVGTFKHVSEYEEFSSVPAEREGYYFPVRFGDDYSDKEITVQRKGGKAKKSKDREWVLRLTDGADTVYTVKAAGVPDRTLTFAGAKFTK